MASIGDSITSGKAGNIQRTTRMAKPWFTSYTRLWLKAGDERRYCSCVSIGDIFFLPDETKQWACSYCGSVNVTLNCEHCNAPRASRHRKGTAVLRGRLPQAAFLAELSDKFDLQVVHGACSDPRIYTDGEIIFQARDCTVEQIYIESLVALSVEEAAVGELSVAINGIFSLHYDGGEGVRWA
jgi:hypothetical protein